MYFSFHLLPLFAGVVNLVLAIFVVFINSRRRLNQVYCALGLSLAWWNLGVYYISRIDSESAGLIFSRGIFMGVIFLPALVYHFSIETTGAGFKRWKVVAAYSVALGFIALNLTDGFIHSVRPYHGSVRAIGGWSFYLFCLGFFPITAYVTIASLLKFIKRPKASSNRSAKFLIVAMGILLLGAFHDTMPVFGFDHYPGTRVSVISWGSLGASLYGLIIGYSILSDQLFDVRISISRHSATVLRLCFFASIAYLLMLSIGTIFRGTFTGQGLIASLGVLVASAAVTTQIFPKLFGGLSARVEQGLLGDHFEYRDKISAFIHSPQESETCEKLLNNAADLLFGQLWLSAVGIAITGGDSMIRGQALRAVGAESNWQQLLAADSPLTLYFKTTGAEMIDTRSDFQFGSDIRSLCSLLKSASVELAFRIGADSKGPLGVMVVGPKRDGRSLNKLDRELLVALSRNIRFRVERIAILQNEELRQANSARDRFLASINHEIRNPLNGITGIVDMLSANHPDPRSEYLLSTLRACTEQLRSSMDEVLDFTQIESDSVTVTNARVNLNELVRSSCASSDVLEARLALRKAPATDIFVQCDPGKVRQVLSNYLGNAIKYGDPPGAEVDLLADECGPDKVRITIKVTSRGPTLSADELNVLFTALTRGRRARETGAHGTGLGLALCKKMAHAMGGSVGVESVEEKTTFWFRADFPIVSQDALQPIPAPALYPGCRALAVEDEYYNRLVLEHHLKRFGITPTWAENGAAALAAAKTHRFDVILMDWLLPDMDGPELLLKLKQILRGSLPPVIVLSAYSTTNKRLECLAAGAAAFVSKPIDLTKLSAAFELCKLDTSSKADSSAS